MRRIFSVSAVLLILCGLALSQQNTLTPTYTRAAMTATQNTVSVYSATGITAGSLADGTLGSLLYIGQEAMRVQSINGTTLSVRRGTDGTFASAHYAGEAVYFGAPNLFFIYDPGGACTTANTFVAPHINVLGGRIWTCSSRGFWGVNAIGPDPSAIKVITDDYTALINDYVIESQCTLAAANKTVTLPTPARCPGKVYWIFDGYGSAGGTYHLLLAGTISGTTGATCTAAAYGGCRVISTGASWFLF